MPGTSLLGRPTGPPRPRLSCLLVPSIFPRQLPTRQLPTRQLYPRQLYPRQLATLGVTARRANRPWRSVWQLSRLAGLLLIAACGGAGRLNAASGDVLQLPQMPARPVHGIQMALDARAIEGYGYRPVRITLNRVGGGANNAARSFRVELEPLAWGERGNTPRVLQWIELPQGARTVRETIAVPQSATWSMVRVQVFEQGRSLDELHGHLTMTRNQGYVQWSEARPSILFIDKDAPSRDDWSQISSASRISGRTRLAGRSLLPDPRGLLVAAPGEDLNNGFLDSNNVRLDDQAVIGLADTVRRLDVLNLEELPRRWIDYSSADLIVISRQDLETLAGEAEDRLEALRRWATAGNTLVVYGAGEEFRGLAELERLLGMPPLPDGDQANAGWRPPDPGLWGDQVARSITTGTTRTFNGRKVSVHVHSEVSEGTDQLFELAKRPPEANPFVMRPFGLGQVVAFASDDPFPGSAQKWCWMINNLGERQFKTYQRLGVSQHRDNAEFWEWLIPGVGQAPVISFGVLITLFVIGIGPVNYFVLKRLRRLSLLLLTVPLGAATVTTGLFAYALLTDGLGTKVRTRSVAWLDQETGQFASCSRQTYYASIAPSSGLRFPIETLVLPVFGRPQAEVNTGAPFRRRLVWSDQQQLTGDYLRSRVTSQYVVLHAGKRDLELLIRSGEGGTLEVENQLAPRILHLAVRDAQGRLLEASDLVQGQRASLQPTTAETLRTTLRSAYRVNRPEAPGKLSSENYGDWVLADMFGYRRGSSVDSQDAEPSWRDSLLERHLKRYLEDPAGLPAGHYVALVDSNPLVPIGVSGARQVASFHAIIGSWRETP